MPTTRSTPTSESADKQACPPSIFLLIALACGLIAANLYYAQPLIAPISASLGLSTAMAGLIVSMTQIGYGIGLIFVVPMGDLFENRRLVVTILSVAIAAATAATLSTHAAPFLVSALLLGIGSVAVQVLVPYASHLAPPARTGRVVGQVMSGLMLGIMFARPVASIVADALSWHAVFALSALLMTALALVLTLVLPQRQPAPGPSYRGLLVSMTRLVRTEPVLRRRAFYHACLFGAFVLFWTTVPLLLAERFHLSQRGIALFALAGVAGAISAPLAGRAADRGWSRSGTGLAMAVAALSFLGARACGGGMAGLLGLVSTAIVLDFAVTANLSLGQRAIFSLNPRYRSRLNGLYMASFFASGAACSALGAWAYATGGWSRATWIGFALPVAALLVWLTEFGPVTASARAERVR